jgi:hypothetical protein
MIRAISILLVAVDRTLRLPAFALAFAERNGGDALAASLDHASASRVAFGLIWRTACLSPADREGGWGDVMRLSGCAQYATAEMVVDLMDR